mgnify:CR=1 FL=1
MFQSYLMNKNLVDLSFYKDKKIAIFGLGKTGLSALKSMITHGAEVFAWDDNTELVDSIKYFADASKSAESVITSDITPINQKLETMFNLQKRADSSSAFYPEA